MTEDGPFASDTLTNTYVNRLRTRLDLQQPTGVWTNVFNYDAAKRLTNVTSSAGSFDYAYVSLSSTLIKKLSLPNTAYITNDYDIMARQLFTKLVNSTEVVMDAAFYGYNVGNQRFTVTNAANAVINYTYDPISQLKWADSVTNYEDRGYKYDTAWNLNQRTNNGAVSAFTVNSLNELTFAPEGLAYDGNGNMTNMGYYTSTYFALYYDDENRLTSVIPAYSPSIYYTYDGLGRLRKADGAGGYKRYIYDGMRVIQERDSTNGPAVSYTRGNDLSGTLEGAGGIGGMLARSHGYSGGSFTNHNYYHADGNGNITYMVNSAQAMVAQYRYDSYGNQLSSSGTLAFANTYRFSSKEISPQHYASPSGPSLQLYYYGYRCYVPQWQRWLNGDPLGEVGFENLTGGTPSVIGDDPNHYDFVSNNPIDTLDPLGLYKLCTPWVKIPCGKNKGAKCRACIGTDSPLDDTPPDAPPPHKHGRKPKGPLSPPGQGFFWIECKF